MSKVKNSTKKLKAKLEAIKKINDDPKKTVDDLFDSYLKDLPTTDKLFGKKLDSFLDKRKKKKENNKDIFAELIDIAEGFLGVNKKVNPSDKIMSKSRLKKHAMDATKITLESSKFIVLEAIKKVFFEGEGICGANSSIPIDNITIKPKEIDFFNMLTIDPNSASGKIMYELTSPNLNKQKVNRELYTSFGGSPYQFDTNSNLTLFTSSWDAGNQEFNISGLTQGNLTPIKVGDFFNDYYSNIELPDITAITKMAMLMTIQGDGTETTLFNKGMNDLDRLLKKLFAVCGTPTDRSKVKNQNPIDLFDENDEDVEFYFDFNDVEGIDLDEEDARLRGVLKFADCNNFEVPKNTDIIQDFVYLTKSSPNINDAIDKTLSKVAKDAAQQSELPVENLQISIMNLFILKLPKAIAGSVLSPKIFLPIVMMYKMFKSALASLDVKELMKKLAKLFNRIIMDLFWKFIREFWKLIKKDLKDFLAKLIKKILKNKYKRYVTIIKSLIPLLNKIKEMNITNCANLFELISQFIDTALSGKKSFNIPGILLGLSDTLSAGYSQDRALLNITERLQKAGVPMGPLYGDPNSLVDVIKGVIDGHTEEMDTNGFVKVSNKKMTIPTPVGPIVIPPGILNSSGKII
jgi:hypothetical protein